MYISTQDRYSVLSLTSIYMDTVQQMTHASASIHDTCAQKSDMEF